MYLRSTERNDDCFEVKCTELAEKCPYLVPYPKVVSMLFHLYKTPEAIAERIESKTIESAFLRRLVAEAKCAANHPNQNLFAMEELNALDRREQQSDAAASQLPPPSSSASDTTEECLVCGEEVSASDLFALECGHKFCTGCWEGYALSNSDDVFKVCSVPALCVSGESAWTLTSRLASADFTHSPHLQVFKAKCMATGCEHRVGLDVYKRFLPSQKYAKLLSFLISEMVSKNPYAALPVHLPSPVRSTLAVFFFRHYCCNCHHKQRQ